MNEIETIENIEDMIYEIRGMQVMLSSDVAKLYHVETRRINEVIKRNIRRFPETFCFQLTKSEYTNLKSQFAISSLGNTYGGVRYLPYVLTERGILMLSGLLKSDIAEKVNVQVVDAFVKMSHYIKYNEALLPNRVLLLEEKYDEHDEIIKKILDMFRPDDIVKDKIFFKGEFYDAYSMLIDILNSSSESIIIIDNYIDKSLLDILKSINRKITIVTKNISKILKQKYESQYHNITFIRNDEFHDRFIILDNKKLYICGASLKDLGKKCFHIGEIEENEILTSMLNKLEKIVN